MKMLIFFLVLLLGFLAFFNNYARAQVLEDKLSLPATTTIEGKVLVRLPLLRMVDEEGQAKMVRDEFIFIETNNTGLEKYNFIWYEGDKWNTFEVDKHARLGTRVKIIKYTENMDIYPASLPSTLP